MKDFSIKRLRIFGKQFKTSSLVPSRNQNQLPNRLPRFQVAVCLGHLFEGVGMDSKRLDFVVLDPAQQLVHGLVQKLGAVEQKTQVETEYAAVACRQAEGVEARCTRVVPQQAQAIGASALAGQHTVKTVHNEFSDRGQVAITLLQGGDAVGLECGGMDQQSVAGPRVRQCKQGKPGGEERRWRKAGIKLCSGFPLQSFD